MPINDEQLVKDFKDLIRIPNLKACLFHKLEELKHEFRNEIKDYRELENLIDPKEKSKKDESVKVIRFEMRKKKEGWGVNPVDIPQAVINHILSQDAKPGIIKMEKFTLPGGQKVDLYFEKHTKGHFTGSIKEKGTEKETKQASQKNSPIKQAGETKTEEIKALITYLLNYEFFFDCINEEFKDKWKPLIDRGIINES